MYAYFNKQMLNYFIPVYEKKKKLNIVNLQYC